jgi:hypothetical protein
MHIIFEPRIARKKNPMVVSFRTSNIQRAGARKTGTHPGEKQERDHLHVQQTDTTEKKLNCKSMDFKRKSRQASMLRQRYALKSNGLNTEWSTRLVSGRGSWEENKGPQGSEEHIVRGTQPEGR